LRGLRSPEFDDKTMVSLVAITNSVSVLDAKYQKNGNESYSLPKGMSFACDNGKPYHFWMTAYLSWNLSHEQGHSPEAAAAASYTAAKLYQMFTDNGFRNPSEVFASPPFSNAVNSKRLDMVFDAAGALYGATGKISNIDSGFAAITNASDPPKNQIDINLNDPDSNYWTKYLGANIFYAYHRFNQITSPDTIFNYFQQNTK